jgi:hypothetical protein
MLIEAACAIVLLFSRRGWLPSLAVWTGTALLIVIWLSTAAIETSVHRRPVLGNWIRTFTEISLRKLMNDLF